MTAETPELLDKIESYHQKIRNCISKAVEHYQERLAEESAFISPLTKASYIRDFIIENVKKVFFDDASVLIINKHGMITLVFKTEPIIVLKFKKFDKYNRVSSTRTVQSYDYSNQLVLFPELGTTTNLIAGYKWNETGTEIECLIALPKDEKRHAWTVNIPNSCEPKEILNFDQEKSEPIKPTITLKVKQIRKYNDKTS